MVALVLDASIALVFKVWTDSRHVAEWWGPNGFATTVHEMDPPEWRLHVDDWRVRFVFN